MDIFKERTLHPMLIAKEEPPFDDDDYLYELKLDGVRCLLYFDGVNIELRNKRNINLTKKFPEFDQLKKQIKKKCILDGELYVFREGTVDFFEIQKRVLTNNIFKNRLASRTLPATFTAFDILYIHDQLILDKPLLKRKDLLQKTIKENERISISRYIDTEGIVLFQKTSEQGLEGIIAKKKDSKYYPGKKTKDWVKCKNLMDDDFIIVGYIPKEKGMVSLVLAQYKGKSLWYMGHVTMGVSLSYLRSHSKATKEIPFYDVPKGNEQAIWITPYLVGAVKYMERNEHGLRQPIFKGFREDKQSKECRYLSR